MRRRRPTRHWTLGFALMCSLPSGVIAQVHSSSATAVIPQPEVHPLCPGGFPTDLTVMNCEYTRSMRGSTFVNNSLTDKSILSAVVFGLGAQIVQSPGQWKRTWEGYGQRVGVRYNQA